MSSKSRAYEAGAVAGYTYSRGSIPDDAVLLADLLDLTRLLRMVYVAEARSYVPDNPDPEIVEAERAVTTAKVKRPAGPTGFRMNQKQRNAIELRAMRLAIDYFESRGAVVCDVSSNRSYDLDVDEKGVHIAVEVKGTVSDGAEILITHPEVSHQRQAYPHNALALVTAIQLEGDADSPVAIGGELRVVQPWIIDDAALTPISFRCAVQPSTS